jgi:hypothetical protein
VFVGMNPAHNRVFAAIADESENFTLSPISATFCVGTSKESPSYFTIDRNGVLNVAADESFQFLDHLLALVVDLEKHGTLIGLPDKPVYRSRNAHKRAILASISA